jgi:hypothetical protein
MALPRPQELTEQISIVNTTGLKTGSGVSEKTTVVETLFARIEEVDGSLDDEDQQHQSQTVAYEVVTQYVPGVTGFMGITWGDRELEIIAPPQKVYDRNNRPWMIIRATEITERSL